MDCVNRHGQLDAYDFNTLPGQWEVYEEWGGKICCKVAVLDGVFLNPTKAMESGQALMYAAVPWQLGQGQVGHQDVDWAWAGSWMDAAEMAEVLRGTGAG